MKRMIARMKERINRGATAGVLMAALTPLFLSQASTSDAGTSEFTIINDSSLNSAVAAARSRYLATRPGSRLHATILVKESDGTWSRGSYQGTTTSYPASAVKLAYLAASMYKGNTTGQHYAWLDDSVRPMIEVSDNFETGVVVDTITGAPNTSSGSFSTWMSKRRYTENFLNARGLLGNQTIINKTYPTNSNLNQFELQALNTYGSNQMQPNLSAELMLEIVKGKVEGESSAYMSQMLDHYPYGSQSSMGWGLPSGTVYLNKAGWTSSVQNDIAYIRLPNGQEIVIAAFSDTPDTSDPYPHDHSSLGAFADFLLEETGLDAGGPANIRLDNTDSSFSTSGTWSTGTGDYDKYGSSYRYANGGSNATATWNLSLPEAGSYEVAVWWTDDSLRSSSSKYQINHANGSQTVALDQRTRGGKWIYIGTWDFDTSGDSIQVKASSSASGRVIADAIKLSKVPNFPTQNMDNGSGSYGETGSWGTSSGSGFYGSSSRYAFVGDGSRTATWSPSFSGSALCDVYAWWVASSNRAEDAKYVVYHDEGTTTLEVAQDVNGGQWNYLGSFPMTGGTSKVVLNNEAGTNAVVSADAVRIQEIKPLAAQTEVVVDNSDSGFAASNSWFPSTSVSGYLGANYHARATESTGDAASWTATLPSSGSYEVFARWTTGGNRATSAPFIVYHSGGATTVRVNQQQNNGVWVSLGSYSFNSGSNSVSLSCWTSSGDYVIADAIKFVKQ